MAALARSLCLSAFPYVYPTSKNRLEALAIHGLGIDNPDRWQSKREPLS